MLKLIKRREQLHEITHHRGTNSSLNWIIAALAYRRTSSQHWLIAGLHRRTSSQDFIAGLAHRGTSSQDWLIVGFHRRTGSSRDIIAGLAHRGKSSRDGFIVDFTSGLSDRGTGSSRDRLIVGQAHRGTGSSRDRLIVGQAHRRTGSSRNKHIVGHCGDTFLVYFPNESSTSNLLESFLPVDRSFNLGIFTLNYYCGLAMLNSSL